MILSLLYRSSLIFYLHTFAMHLEYAYCKGIKNFKEAEVEAATIWVETEAEAGDYDTVAQAEAVHFKNLLAEVEAVYFENLEDQGHVLGNSNFAFFRPANVFSNSKVENDHNSFQINGNNTDQNIIAKAYM